MSMSLSFALLVVVVVVVVVLVSGLVLVFASVHTSHMSRSCDVTRVQSATEWTASVHTSHMSRSCDCNPCPKCRAVDCFGNILRACPKL